MKEAHVLKGNKTSSFPTQFILFDTETVTLKKCDNGVYQKFQMAWTCYLDFDARTEKGYTEKYTFFKSSKKLWEYTLSASRKRRPLNIISSNIWFDMRVSNAIPFLLTKGFINTKRFKNGMSEMYVFQKGDTKLVMYNLQNWFRTSVAEMGKELKLPKMKVNFDTDNFEYIKKYCKRDTEIIVETWKKWRSFIVSNDLGCFGKTISSQAFNTFRHRFYKTEIYIHNIQAAINLERRCMKGGRVECYRIGKVTGKKTYKIDINSAYPAVMRDYKFPIKLLSMVDRISVNRLDKYLQKRSVCAHVIIDTDQPVYSITHNKERIYPTGKFHTWLTTPELKHAIKYKHITKVITAAIYKQEYIFRDYVNYFSGLREQYKKDKNKIYDSLSKYLQNCLFGKFAQKLAVCRKDKKCNKKLFGTETVYYLDEDKLLEIMYFAGRETWIEKKEEEGFHSFVAIAAHVTAYQRLKIYKTIQKIGRNNCYYTDTDCIFCNEKGYNKIKNKIHATKLGYWDLEETTTKLDIRTNKDYTFGKSNKIKGVKKNAKEIRPNVFEQSVFPSFLSDMINTNKKPYLISNTIKTLARVYKKGTIKTDGTVKPFHFKVPPL